MHTALRQNLELCRRSVRDHHDRREKHQAGENHANQPRPGAPDAEADQCDDEPSCGNDFAKESSPAKFKHDCNIGMRGVCGEMPVCRGRVIIAR